MPLIAAASAVTAIAAAAAYFETRHTGGPSVTGAKYVVGFRKGAGFINGPMPDRPAEGNPPLGALSVFSSPRTPADAMPRDLADAARRFNRAFDHVQPTIGEVDTEQSRQAIAEAGADRQPVFIAPTSTNAVCYSVGRAAFGCMAALIDGVIGWNVSFDSPAPGTYNIKVHGVVADDVTGVEVGFRTGQREEYLAAVVGRNAFLLDVKGSDIDPSSISDFRLGRRDGSVTTVAASPPEE